MTRVKKLLPSDRARVLVTGSTGYIGGLLVPALLEAGVDVRVLVRHQEAVDSKPWCDAVDVIVGDARSPRDLHRALQGIDTAYYLLHSMGGDGDFVRRDRELAQGFATAAETARISRVVYLGGLRPTDHREPSDHLASRAEVGRILLGCDVPTIVLQAGIVLGAGSASFDMLRYLSGRLPVMITPRWVHNRVQPVAIRDALHYLVAVGTADIPVDRTYDLAGPQVLTYEEMMQRYAAVAGLRPRHIWTAPVLTPGLASHWVGAVTPVPSGVARPLMASLVHDVVAQEDDLVQVLPLPEGGRTRFDDAVSAALDDVPRDRVAVRAEASASVAGLLALPVAHAVHIARTRCRSAGRKW